MKKYKNLSRISGVTRYETGEDFILVEFKDGATYKYSYLKPGKPHVEKMKKLAVQGRGLSTYISQHVREQYELVG